MREREVSMSSRAIYLPSLVTEDKLELEARPVVNRILIKRMRRSWRISSRSGVTIKC